MSDQIKKFSFLAVFCASFIALSLPGTSRGAGAVQVDSFSPEGIVKGVRQARVHFNQQMVSFGDPRAPIPFDVSCSAKGTGRWADGKNWIYDFDSDLPAGEKCTFAARPGVKSLDGGEWTGKREFSFSTGGPSIIQQIPYEGSQIQEDQIFVLTLDAEADRNSIIQNARFLVDGVLSPIPFTFIEGKVREEILENQGFRMRFRFRRHHQPKPKETEKPKPIYVIQAVQKFPPMSRVTLLWGAGITTLTGIPTTEEQTLKWTTRESFSARFNCERENANAPCIPMATMRLGFNAEVPWTLAKEIRLRASGGKEWKAKEPKWQEGQEGDAAVYGVDFEGPFPEKTTFKITLPSGFKDDAGRKLIDADKFPLEVSTGPYPPMAKFPAEFGVIESKAGEPVLPVTLRAVEPELKARLGIHQVSKNGTEDAVDGKVLRVSGADIEAIRSWTGAISHQSYGDRRGVSILSVPPDAKTVIHDFEIKKPNGERPFEVVGIPLEKPGLYIVEIESRLLGQSLLGGTSPMYASTAALVTNLSVHFKEGRESSLVWVTSLDQAKPVPGALVAVRSCDGALQAKGKTDANGLLYIDKKINRSVMCHDTFYEYNHGLFVTAEKDDDFSFVHTSWQHGIENWRFNQPMGNEESSKMASTVFDRTLFRAGETVHMKNYVRRHVMAGFAPFYEEDMPKVAQIMHQGSGQKYEIPIKWDENGISEATWTIPKGAKLGEYTVRLKKTADLKAQSPEEQEGDAEGEGEGGYHYYDYNTGGWHSGEFRVEEYRVPLMKGKIRGPAEKLVAPAEASVDLSVEYLSGGGAGGLPVEVTYQQPRGSGGGTTFEGFEDYSFATGQVREENQPSEEAQAEEEQAAPLQKVSMNLDPSGTGRARLTGFKKLDTASSIQVEMAYRDPNGEMQTVSQSLPTYPARTLVGLKPDSWFASKNGVKFYAAAADLAGKPVPGAQVDVELIERKVFSHRKRLVGGFYAYENRVQLLHHGKACSGKADKHGLLICEFKPAVSGNLILQAKTADAAGNTSYTNMSLWVYDKDDWWFEQDDNDRMDVLAEQKSYEPGDKASFQIRMPFHEATALVTVEREGVMDAYIMPVQAKKPLIEIPIKKNYAPNVYVSVLAVRGRVGGIQPTALLDLGKPAYKFGVSAVHVGWRGHELKVKVASDRDVYHVRDKAKVTVEVKTADGSPLPKSGEIALAAVDEGLLQLKPNESWKLLDNLMGPRGWEVETSTEQMQVVGKRHFGLKALPSGGGGGKNPTRELFDTLLLWKGRVPLSSDGTATVEVPLNDSLTGFRIVAVASAGLDRFGTGQTGIRTTQDLMLLSGIPPVVREGDHLPATFTLRNATTEPMHVQVQAKAKALHGKFESKDIQLSGGEAKTISWTIDVPVNVTSIDYEVEAQVLGNKKASDHLKITQKVIEAVPVHVFQGTIAQVDKPVKMKVERPKDAIPDKGGIHVILQPTILTGLDGVKRYMTEYPYSCLEQRVSKSIALENADLWKRTMDDLPSYLAPNGLARYFPDCHCESDALTTYVLRIADEAGLEMPAGPHRQMAEALKKFVEGSIVVYSSLPTVDLTIRKIAALEALSRFNQASWQLMTSLEITPNLWPTSAVLDWYNILKRVNDIPEREMKTKAAEQILRSRLNFQGTIMTFSTEHSDDLWWLMLSTDENAIRLVLSMLKNPDWKEDMPRIMRGAIYRQHYGHWLTTPANAWGVVATRKFAENFEKIPVGGTSTATLAQSSQPLAWAQFPKGKTLKFDWQDGVQPLEVSHSGSGKPWATIQSLAAIPLKQPLFTGYKVTKTVTPNAFKKGQVVRVHLDLESQSDMTWVVLNDPIPAGATILGSGLGNDSSLQTQGEKREGWVWPVFEERAQDAFRAYYAYVPKGKWTVEYTVRLNESGTMQLPATHVEAMYAPEMFGDNPNPPMVIQE
jgi:uncharacterized protein YfaS (alpha-2-macroglobulin family)